jgi:hypothetical protein
VKSVRVNRGGAAGVSAHDRYPLNVHNEQFPTGAVRGKLGD